MSQDREELRLEVEQLRKQLESIQEAHAQELTQLRADLDESEAAKEHAETQYQTLLNRVEKIKETLGDRLKRDKAELEEAKDRVEELEAQNDELQKTLAARDEETDRLREEVQEQGRELASLRSRSNLSQQNWLKEKDDMARQMQHLKSELESTTAAMGEWEVIAMEERSLRESLADKVSDLEEQVASARESFERADADREAQSQAVDRLQRALQELQETRKRELREMVESTEEQVQALKKLAQEADARAAEAESAKATLSKELERTAPFEKEVKEKNLLIGKLRHEAIVLNDHLTKALKYIKKTKPEETIDK
jgi:chromosome segregation ATPase